MPFASLVAHRDVSLLLYQIWWFHASPIVIILCLYAIAFVHPRLVLRIRRHPPVAARRQGNGADFHAVRHTVPLELLRPEAAIEIFQPFEDGFAAEIVLERNAAQLEYLFRRISEANRIVEEEVVQRVRPGNKGLWCSFFSSTVLCRTIYRGKCTAKLLYSKTCGWFCSYPFNSLSGKTS